MNSSKIQKFEEKKHVNEKLKAKMARAKRKNWVKTSWSFRKKYALKI